MSQLEVRTDAISAQQEASFLQSVRSSQQAWVQVLCRYHTLGALALPLAA